MISESKRVELRRNFEVFREVLPTILPDHENEFALMRHGKFVAYYANASDALKAGQKNFDDDLFSVQEVTTRAADFGWFSRAPSFEHL